MNIRIHKLLDFLQSVHSEKLEGIGFGSLNPEQIWSSLLTIFSEVDLYRYYAQAIGVEYVSLKNLQIPKELLFLFPENSMLMYKFVPFEDTNGVINIAMIDPLDYTSLQAVKFLFRDKGLDFKVYFATEPDVESVLSTLKSMSAEVKKSLDQIEEEREEVKESVKETFADTQTNSLDSAPIIKMVSVILKNAVEGGASDIHIEGSEQNVRVRFRVDGVLHTSLVLPKTVYSAVVARIKILSNLKIDEQRKPQDGRFSIVEQNKKIDFRVSTFPTEFGEKVVLRILDTSEGIKELKDLGYVGPRADLVQMAIQKPFGMILVTGPTGSGKSTTLYTMLNMVNEEGINIVTLEDPVEYFLPGVNQSQVHPEINYTFASGLRSILRQDPDIIMVGEIRDGETAGLAVQSALTGHLVFSTLHTNTAAGAIPRLMDMGVEPFLLAASLDIILAQRLVRKLCEKCKKPVDIDERMLQLLEKEFQTIPKEYLLKHFSENKMPQKVFEPVGCEYCKNGFKGRVAIFEAVFVEEDLRNMIAKEYTEDKLYAYLRANNFVSMKQDGLTKVLKGIVSMEELLTSIDV
jgi:type IV pilus assembly protein PilB